MALDGSIKAPELCFHINGAFIAYWALVRGLLVFAVAYLVDAMAAKHEDNCPRGCEHIFPTDWTIAIRYPLDALVVVHHGHGHTHTTSLST